MIPRTENKSVTAERRSNLEKDANELISVYNEHIAKRICCALRIIGSTVLKRDISPSIATVLRPASIQTDIHNSQPNLGHRRMAERTSIVYHCPL